MSQTPTRLIDLTLGSSASDARQSLTECLIRPLGVVHGPAAEAAVENSLAIWLAGGNSAFTTAELIETTGSETERDYRSVRQVALMRAPNVVARLRLLTDPRPPIAGLTWASPRVLAVLRLVDARGEAGERSTKAAVQRGRQLALHGADIVAVTAAGLEIGDVEEVERIVPVVAELAEQGIRTAVSTRRPMVMRAAARAGARLVIDDSPNIDDDTLYTLGDLALPVVLRRGGRIGAVPRTGREAMDLAVAVHSALESRMEILEGAGVPRERIIVDPGIGAHQPAEENIALLHSIAMFHGLGCPILVDCGGFDDAAASGADRHERLRTDAAGLALAVLSQGVQMVAAPEPGEVWAAATAFRALADAHIVRST